MHVGCRLVDRARREVIPVCSAIVPVLRERAEFLARHLSSRLRVLQLRCTEQSVREFSEPLAAVGEGVRLAPAGVQPALPAHVTHLLVHYPAPWCVTSCSSSTRSQRWTEEERECAWRRRLRVTLRRGSVPRSLCAQKHRDAPPDTLIAVQTGRGDKKVGSEGHSAIAGFRRHRNRRIQQPGGKPMSGTRPSPRGRPPAAGAAQAAVGTLASASLSTLPAASGDSNDAASTASPTGRSATRAAGLGATVGLGNIARIASG